MQFLKTLLWIIITIILVVFANANWTDTTISLWGGLKVDVKLPILILIIFLIGFLPMLTVYRARVWAMKRRLEVLERQTAAQEPVMPLSGVTFDPDKMDQGSTS